MKDEAWLSLVVAWVAGLAVLAALQGDSFLAAALTGLFVYAWRFSESKG